MQETELLSFVILYRVLVTHFRTSSDGPDSEEECADYDGLASLINPDILHPSMQSTFKHRIARNIGNFLVVR